MLTKTLKTQQHRLLQSGETGTELDKRQYEITRNSEITTLKLQQYGMILTTVIL
ncbi:46421_t:CDS:2, partial [Gigaspora margarita]